MLTVRGICRRLSSCLGRIFPSEIILPFDGFRRLNVVPSDRSLTMGCCPNHLVQFLVMCSVFCVALAEDSDRKCHSAKVQHVNGYLAAKTPYRIVKNFDEKPFNFPDCKPARIWMLVRHGTRSPGIKMINKMRTHLVNLREIIVNAYTGQPGQLCEKEINRLKAWSPLIEESEDKHLTHEGEDEMVELAERYQKRFPTLFPENYDNGTYKFQYTATQRTGESARYFTIGLFGRPQSNKVWYPEPLTKDPVLRFYKLCNRWRSQVDKNPATLIERRKFERGPEVLHSLKQISHRIGVNGTIGINDAEAMYITCTFETAWDKKNVSPWCSVFSEDDLKILEYGEDLKYYWVDGYGHELSYRQACPVINDMLANFAPSNSHTTTVYFTHSGTILKVLCHLGLYKDTSILNAENFRSMLNNRKFRVGQIDSFGANIAFVLYSCSKEEKLLVLHQERPITLPGCPQGTLCPLSTFKSKFKDSIEKCNFEEMCQWPPPASPAA